jgi:hypothetical protein
MKKLIIGLFLSLVVICSLCAMGGQQAYDGSASPGAAGIVSFLPLIIVYVLIGLYVRHDNKKLRGLESVFQYKHNKESAYVEYRQWKLVWGLMVDSQKEANRVIDDWNDNGYTCIGFQRSMLVGGVSIFKMLAIIIIPILTLGFVSYYVGQAFLFIKSDSLKRNGTLEE